MRSRRYIVMIVRLLLLLSALLSALSGIATGRAQAQPAVAASVAGAAVAQPGAGLARQASLPFAAGSPERVSPALLPAVPPLVPAPVRRRPMVERRRE